MKISPYFDLKEFDHGVKEITFKRPNLKNALNKAMILELSALFKTLSEDYEPKQFRLLILKGQGDVFSAGADLNYMREQSKKNFDENLEDANSLGEMFQLLSSIPCPVICAVQGAAIGGGLGLCVCSDFVIAEEKAVFATSEVKLGIVPAVISPYIIRKLGVSHASHLMLSGNVMTANEAHQIGLVNKCTTWERFDSDLEKTIQIFLQAGPNAVRLTKELIQKASPLPDPILFDFTAQKIALARSSKEGKEGLKSFFEKKKPHWCP